MTDETAARLAQIRAREQAATPGPWTWTPGMIQAPGDEIIMWPANIPLCDDDELDAAMRLGTCGQHAGDHAEDNLAFLAAAREDVPWLLNLVGQLRARIAAVRAATEEWHAFALRYRDEPDHAAQAAWWARRTCPRCGLTALDGDPADAAHPLGVVEFPQDITDEEMTRWAAAWEAAQGPERPLTLDLGNRTATFRAKPWPAEYDADAVARETAEQTPPGGTIEQ